MPRDSLQSVVQYLHRIIDVGPGAASDAELLDRFATNRDESAFALLVHRHGPLILGVCQRVLHHEHDSEDVFQATFLALARRANSISKKDSLASWLYKVAFRIACRARGKGPMLTNQAALQAESEPDADAIWRDLRPILDQEIAQLRETYRVPIVLCYLEGKTHEEAAELLGWPKGTLAARLARGRERLRQRLTRRGWTLSAAALTTVLADKAGATAISAELMRTTVQAALAYVSGTSVAVLSAKAVALAEGVLQMMWYSKVKMAVVMLLAVALTGSGVGWAMFAGGAGPEQVGQKPKAEQPGDARADIAAMRAEIAKLRAELEAAMKKIKNLEEGGQGAKLPREDLYRGKPLDYWLGQLKDGDPKFRAEAVEVIGFFARKNRELIPLLISAIKEGGPSKSRTPTLGTKAAMALGELGPTAVPALREILKEKVPPEVHSLAANSLARIGPDASPAVPELLQLLKDELAVPKSEDAHWGLRSALVGALGSIGPDANSALPTLASAFELAMADTEQKNAKGGFRDTPFHSLNLSDYNSKPANVVRAMVKIDAMFKNVVPGDTWAAIERSDSLIGYIQVDTAWRRLRAELKKKYAQQNP